MTEKRFVTRKLYNVKKCKNGCCTYNVFSSSSSKTEYKHTYKIMTNEKNDIKKAGIFIYDMVNKKVLLVQSYNYKWGSPKGHVEKGEEVIDAALRECKEETGIILYKDLLKTFYRFPEYQTIYYLYDTNNYNYDINFITSLEKNDCTGIGWFNVSCINSLINDNTFLLTYQCKQLLKMIF